MWIALLFPLLSSVWNQCPVLGNGLGMGTKLTQFQFETNLETDATSTTNSWLKCMNKSLDIIQIYIVQMPFENLNASYECVSYNDVCFCTYIFVLFTLITFFMLLAQLIRERFLYLYKV